MPRETTVSGMPAVGGGGAWLLLPSTITCHSNSTAANPSVAMTRRANAPGTMLAKAYDPVEAPTRTPSIVQEYESKSPSGSDAALVTDTAAVAVLEAPPLSVTVNTTLEVPAWAKGWPASGPDAVDPSPKSHAYD